MYEPTDEEIKADILHKLTRKRMWGGKHTSFENIMKGYDPKLRKRIKKLSKKLIRDNLIISHPTSYGLQISLNPREFSTIMRIVEKFFGKQY